MTVRIKSVECEVERLLGIIGGKWKVLLLRELFRGPRRHSQIWRALPGISQKVLTSQLRELEVDGVVLRRDFQTSRPHVEYSLSPFGSDLRGLILEMHELAAKRSEVIKRTPPRGRFVRSGDRKGTEYRL